MSLDIIMIFCQSLNGPANIRECKIANGKYSFSGLQEFMIEKCDMI